MTTPDRPETGPANRSGSTARGRFSDAAYAAEYATGDREKSERSARRNVVARVAVIAVGAVVTIGLAMLLLPGPGIVVVFVGLGILAQELPWAERLLSLAKRRAHVDKVARQPMWVRIALVAATAAGIAASVIWYLKR